MSSSKWLLWGAHRCPLSDVQCKPFKEDINNTLSDYVLAVESSTETAQQGVTFAVNAAYWCETLGDQQVSDSDRNQFMRELTQIGAKALEDAQRTCSVFDYVQRNLYEVCIQEIGPHRFAR